MKQTSIAATLKSLFIVLVAIGSTACTKPGTDPAASPAFSQARAASLAAPVYPPIDPNAADGHVYEYH